jgi:hypothetical protein
MGISILWPIGVKKQIWFFYPKVSRQIEWFIHREPFLRLNAVILVSVNEASIPSSMPNARS